MAKRHRRKHGSLHAQEKRRERRIMVALPVKVTLVGQESPLQLACTLDVTPKGARLHGLRGVHRVGELLEIERGVNKDLFRVVWIGEPGTPREGQVGVLCETHTAPIWEEEVLGRPEPEELGEETEEAVGRPAAIQPHEEAIREAILEQEELERKAKPAWYTVPRYRLRALLLVGLLLTALGGWGYNQRQQANKRPVAVPARMELDDGMQIRQVTRWRLAASEDFDLDLVLESLRKGHDATGHIWGNFGGGPTELDSAYILVANQPADSSVAGIKPPARRFVMLVNDQLRYDINLHSVAFATLVPKSRFGNFLWLNRAPKEQPDGDGVLIVRDKNDSKSGLVIYASGDLVVMATPKDYRTVVP